MNENDENTKKVGPDGLPCENDSDNSNNNLEEGFDVSEESEGKTISGAATVFNMINSILGAGLLSMANSFVPTGFVTSIILLLLMAGLSLVSTIMVIILSHETNSMGLGELATKILGKIGAIVLAIFNLLFLILGLISYLIIAGDSLISWFDLGGKNYSSGFKRSLVVLIYSIIPISLTIPRNIRFLRFCSTATVILISFYSIVMLIKMGIYLNKNNNKINPTASVALLKFDMFNSFSTYGISFSLPAVVMPAIKLYNPSLSKRKKVAFVAIVIAFIFVVLSGVTGYIIYGDNSKGNILLSFNSNDILIIIVRAGFFVIVTCAYPMLGQSVMGSWGSLIFKDDNSSGLSNIKRIVVIVLTNIIPLIIAMFLPDVKTALGIAGALGGCVVDFVFPSIFWIVYHKNEYKKSDYRNILCVIFAVFGCITAVISTYQAVVSAINSFK